MRFNTTKAYFPIAEVIASPHLPPLTGFLFKISLISFNSSSLISTLVAPKFSSNLSALLVPGMGIAPCALTHARASWAGVHPFFSAISSKAWRSFRLLSRCSLANRPASPRMSSLNFSGSLYFPVRNPAPRGENATTWTPSSFAVAIRPLFS